MQEPTTTDAVLGGESSQSFGAVLGGIEGARQRVSVARTFAERVQAIQVLAKYDREEASRASRQLFKITLNVSPDTLQGLTQATNTMMRAIFDAAASQEVQSQVQRINNDMLLGFQSLGLSITHAFQPVVEALNNSAASSTVNPENLRKR